MTARRLAVRDQNGDLMGIIICDSDEAYEQAIRKIDEWKLPAQQAGDLPSLEELKASRTQGDQE